MRAVKISKEKLMERKIKIIRSTLSGFENYVTENNNKMVNEKKKKKKMTAVGFSL